MVKTLKKEIYSFLPAELCSILEKSLSDNDWHYIHEIRVYKGGPVVCRFNFNNLYISTEFTLVSEGEYYVCDEGFPDYILNSLTKGSTYAYASQLCSGYITAIGGHRVGFAGTPVMREKEIVGMKNLSFANIRICRDIEFSISEMQVDIIYHKPYKNIMIVAPPKCGKTTFVRFLAKKISSQKCLPSVVVIDERGEIFAQENGISAFKSGINSCVLSYIPKLAGLEFAVKNLSPDIIICDEISTYDEAIALKDAITAGVNIIFTVHGKNHNDILKTNKYSCLREYLDYYVELSTSKGPGTIERCGKIAL